MSCSGVAAGAVVQASNGQRFQHVHIMKEMSMTSQTGLQSTLVAAMLLPEQQRLQAGLPVTPWIVLTRTAQSFTTSERGVLQSDP